MSILAFFLFFWSTGNAITVLWKNTYSFIPCPWQQNPGPNGTTFVSASGCPGTNPDYFLLDAPSGKLLEGLVFPAAYVPTPVYYTLPNGELVTFGYQVPPDQGAPHLNMVAYSITQSKVVWKTQDFFCDNPQKAAIQYPAVVYEQEQYMLVTLICTVYLNSPQYTIALNATTGELLWDGGLKAGIVTPIVGFPPLPSHLGISAFNNSQSVVFQEVTPNGLITLFTENWGAFVEQVGHLVVFSDPQNPKLFSLINPATRTIRYTLQSPKDHWWSLFFVTGSERACYFDSNTSAVNCLNSMIEVGNVKLRWIPGYCEWPSQKTCFFGFFGWTILQYIL